MAKRTKLTLALLSTLYLFSSNAVATQNSQSALKETVNSSAEMSLTADEMVDGLNNMLERLTKENDRRVVAKKKAKQLENETVIEPLPYKGTPRRINALEKKQAPLYPEREKPTYDNKTRLSLKLAQKWVDMDYTPIIQNGKIIHFYGESVPTVVLKPLFVSNIEFSPEETIVPDGIHLGDKVCWNIKEVYRGEGDDQRAELVVKSKCLEETQAALIVITTKRVYHFKLISTTKKQTDNWTPYVGFSYPEEPARSMITLARLTNNKLKKAQEAFAAADARKTKEQKSVPKTSAADISFDFTVQGDSRIWPLRVFSLGHQTVIEMRDTITRYNAPALLVEDLNGDTELVSYRFINNRYVVDQLIHKATLITGVGWDQIKVIIKNTRPDNG